MKTTSKIVIGLAAAPFALTLIYFIVTSLLVEKQTVDVEELLNADIEKIVTTRTAPFSCIEIKGNSSVYVDGGQLNVIKSNRYDIETTEYCMVSIEHSVKDSVLCITLNELIPQNVKLTIHTPSIASVKTMIPGCEIRGFDAESLTVKDAGDLVFKDCNIGYAKVNVIDYYRSRLDITADCSNIHNLLVAESPSNLDLQTPNDGRIDTLDWNNPDEGNYRLGADIANANVGTFKWEKNYNQTMNFDSDKSVEINIKK